MSSNHTEHYNLSQWEKSDKVLMEDFNADNAKIDAALAALQASQLRLHTGVYLGTGDPVNTIELPFKPRFFWLQRGINTESRLMIFGDETVLVCQHGGEPTAMFNSRGAIITIKENTIRIEALESLSNEDKMTFSMNSPGARYCYLAIG